MAGSRSRAARPLINSRRSSKTSIFRLTKKGKKRLTRWGIVAANLVVVAVIGLIAVNTNDTSPTTVKAAQSQSLASQEAIKPLDSLSSADEAVHIARMTGLQEATAVVNKADSVNAQLMVATPDEAVVAKPQIVGAGLKSQKDIQIYKAVKGDTVSSLASRFGISADTIRLSNGLTGNEIAPGKKLLISPINGIVYTVKAGDTPDSLARKYYADKNNLLIFNDAEATGRFRVGERIVIPDGVQPSAPAATVAYSGGGSYGYGFAFGSAPVYGSNNGYDYGWCTWHAANRRLQIGRPVPNNLGNAVSWLSLAQAAGMPTGSVPKAGAVLYHKNIGGLGHVAFVEKVNPDGSALVSDMNYPLWGVVTYRTITPADFGNYAFIY